MTLKWPIQKIAEAPLQIIDGDRGKNYPKHTDFQDVGRCLFLNTGNVTRRGFSFNQCQFITESKDEALRKGKLLRGDVVMTTRGTIGNVAYYSDVVPFEHVRINSGMVIFRSYQEKLLPEFLYQFLQSINFKRQVNLRRTGAAQPQLPIRDIKNISIPVPTLAIQNCIADILSAYDDLIEINRQRIALLERAGREIYREWFVRLRFPGHEHTKIVDGVPEDWESMTYADVFKFLGGFAFKSKSYQPEGRFGIVTIKNVHNARFIPECASRLDDIPEKIKEHCVLDTGDVLLSLTGDVGRCCIVFGESYLLNQRVAKVVGNTGIPKSFAYWAFSNEITRRELENLAHGAAQSNLSPVTLGNRKFIKPATIVLESFGKIADPIFWQITTLNLEIVQLNRARDLLLPRLLSGKLTV